MPPPDGTNLDRLKAGHRDAWDGFVAKHRRMVYAVGYRMTGNTADAEEASQEAFLAFSKALPGFRGDASPSTFLYRIAVNASIRLSRRRADATTLEAELEAPTPEEGRDEILLKVRAAVLGLPPQQRAVFTLRHYQGQKLPEIAEALRISEGTVKAHLNQALANLRDALQGEPVSCLGFPRRPQRLRIRGPPALRMGAWACTWGMPRLPRRVGGDPRHLTWPRSGRSGMRPAALPLPRRSSRPSDGALRPPSSSRPRGLDLQAWFAPAAGSRVPPTRPSGDPPRGRAARSGRPPPGLLRRLGGFGQEPPAPGPDPLLGPGRLHLSARQGPERGSGGPHPAGPGLARPGASGGPRPPGRPPRGVRGLGDPGGGGRGDPGARPGPPQGRPPGRGRPDPPERKGASSPPGDP